MNVQTSFKGVTEDGDVILDVHEHEYDPGQEGLSIESRMGGVLVNVTEVRALRDFLTTWLDRVAAEAKS